WQCCAASCVSTLLIVRRPLVSALFPYTTLFRSPTGGQQSDDCVDHGTLVDLFAEGGVGVTERGVAQHATADLGGECLTYGGTRRGRKSTRLNSSHVSISYAVFCLKKINFTIHEH